MRRILKFRGAAPVVSALLWCSCANTPERFAIVPASELPAEVTMNKDAGRGNWLFVTLRLESGEELPFFLDTGAVTFFDKSLEPKLTRLPTTTTNSNRYAAPPLILGGTRLITGDSVSIRDLKGECSYAGRPVMGVLGIDCMKHYCIQLDFEAGKVRFLDPGHLDTATLGKAFPLTFRESAGRPFLRNGSLVEGVNVNPLVDLGYDSDGGLNPQHFRREVREGRLMPMATPPGGREPDFALLSRCAWNGNTYTNLIIGNDWNVLGLRFLARHLVTFNFPKGTMYLKQTTTGPLLDEDVEAGMKFLITLKRKGELPGWSKDDQIEDVHPRASPEALNVNIRKQADLSTYRYRLLRASKDGPWKLQRAWRTDQNHHTLEEYPVP